MKKQLLAQILSLALILQTASPLALAKEIPQEESPQTVATLSDSAQNEIASLSLYDQYMLSQISTFSRSTSPTYGTENTPFVISTAEHLIELADLINDGTVTYFIDAHYQLVNDIDCSGVEMTAIGTSSNRFKGDFDGNGKVISNMTVGTSSDNYQGLFGYTEDVAITNLGIENCNVNGDDYTGGLIGYAKGITTIEYCYVTGSVTGADDYTGGFISTAEGTTTIENCYFTGNVTGGWSYVGGLIGRVIDKNSIITIKNSYVTGNVTGKKESVGGLVGEVYDSTITNCSATGAVTGASSVGGLVGNMFEGTIQKSYATATVSGAGNRVGGLAGYISDSTIESCYATGSVTATVTSGTYTVSASANGVGGLVGYCSYDSRIQNSYATGNVAGEVLNSYNFAYNVGGLVGFAYGYSSSTLTIQNCYATGAVSGTHSVGGVLGGIQKTSGFTYEIENSVALNPSVARSLADATNINRVVGATDIAYTTLAGNYAWSGMTVYYGTTSITPTSGADLEDGADLTYNTTDGFDKQFSDIFDNTVDSGAWVYATDGLPTLKDVGGTQTSALPYYLTTSISGSMNISTVGELQALADYVNSGKSVSTDIFTLTADLDLSGVSNWTAIGTESYKFQGTFNGDNFTISNLSINKTATDYQGLFGYIYGATITDLELVNCNVSGQSYVGGLVGRAAASTIENCNATGAVTGTNVHVGGLVGYAVSESNKKVTIQNCYAAVTVIGAGVYSNVGGLVGEAITSYGGTITITNCYATGAVTGTGNSNNVGGLMGYANVSSSYGTTTITNCYATGAVTGTGSSSNVGGLVGYANNNGTSGITTIENCYATGAVTGTGSSSNVGGLLGKAYHKTSATSTSIKNSVALNPSGTNTSDIYRVLGADTGSVKVTLADNYAWSGMTLDDGTTPATVTGVSNADENGADLNHTGAAFDTLFTTIFASDTAWDFTGELPILKDVGGTQSSDLPSYITSIAVALTTTISTVEELQALADHVNSGGDTSTMTFTLMNDLDLSGVANWTPIGNYSEQFVGNFDGGGHVISNLTINNPTADYQGLFGYTNGATIKNVGIENCNISGGFYVGGLVGNATDATIQSCYVTGSVSGTSIGECVGGLIGLSLAATISNCYTTAKVSGNNVVGGLLGGSGTGTTIITHSYATGAVSGTEYVGGLAGALLVAGSTIKNSVALNSSVSMTSSASTTANRVVGYKSSGTTLTNNYAWDGMVVTRNSTPVDIHTDELALIATDAVHGADTTIINGIFMVETASDVYDTLFENMLSFDSTWVIPTGSLELPYIKSVGDHRPVISLVQQESSQKSPYPNTKTATGSAKYGQSGTVDLSTWGSLTGSSFGTVSIADTDSVLVGNTATLSGNILSFTMDSDSGKVGKFATVTIPVSNTNYADFDLVVTLTMVTSSPVSFTVTKCISSYTQKQVFDPTGLEISVNFQDGTTETIAYSGNESLFTFHPALGTALTPSDTTVKITYGGLTVNYPITVTPIYDLSGTIKSNDGSLLEGAEVELYQNGDPVGMTQTTLVDGAFSFENVKEGIYNLVATYTNSSTTVRTVLVVLDQDSEAEIVMPKENVNSKVEIDEVEEVLAVGGVDLVADLLGENTTEKIEVSLEIVAPEKETQTAIKEKAEELGKDETVGLWLDVTITKSIDGDAPETISNTSPTLLEIVFELPTDFQNKNGYAVYREHESEIEKIYTSKNSDGEYIEINRDKTILTLYVCKFSAYGVAWADSAITDPDSGGTTSPSPSVPEVEDTEDNNDSGTTSSPSSSVTYPILKESENGTATISPERVENGKTVTITVTPDEGYELDYITVVDANNNKVTVKENEDGTYSFTQPLEKVTIEIFFTESDPEPEPEEEEIFPEQLFYDVKTTDWFYPYVKFVLTKELMTGMGSGRFAPEEATLRGMIVTVLYSLAEKPMPKTVMIFDDVKTTDYFYLPCLWAYQQGIVAGIGNNLFAADRAVTREEICLFLYQYALSQTDLVTGYAPDAAFTDGESISAWAREAVNWCNANGIVTGHQGRYFSPTASAKRSEIATMLTKFVLLLEN